MKTIDYSSKNIIEINRILAQSSPKVTLTGKDLTMQEVISVMTYNSQIVFTRNQKTLNNIFSSYQAMISDIVAGKPVYGCNTSYGGQAARILNKGVRKKRIQDATNLSKGLVFLDVGTGPVLPQEIVKSAMLIRINMLMQGVSGVRLTTLDLLRRMINSGIIPEVNEYGGIGASGDLIHNQRIIDAARGFENIWVTNKNKKRERAKSALKRMKIPLMKLQPKEGLGLVNGDNFSTAFTVYILNKLIEYILISSIISAMTIEILKGTNRSFHPLLSEVRPHPGQKEAASIYRFLLSGSKLAHQELQGHQIKAAGIKVQDAYSLRCLSQFEGVYLETIKKALNTTTISLNSVSDNPLWVPPDMTCPGEESWQWVSGGNFLAMHAVETLDSLRKIITQLVKKHDRHLARLVDVTDNNGLSANLSDTQNSITHCTFKGIQIQLGMFEVYSVFLANPISTLFGVHEERNQDISSHATTSGALTLKNLDLLKFSLAGMLLAVTQGADLRGGPQLLSPKTRILYDSVRQYTKRITADKPLFSDLRLIANLLDNGTLSKVVREKIFNQYNEK